MTDASVPVCGVFPLYRSGAITLFSLVLASVGFAAQPTPPVFQASAPSTRVNATLKADQPKALIELNGWYKVNLGNAPTTYTRKVVNLFSLTAANLTRDEKATLAWKSKDVPGQAAKYVNSDLAYYSGVSSLSGGRAITPDVIRETARKIIAAAGKGVKVFWHLPNKAKTKRWGLAVRPGQTKVHRVTAYTRTDLETLMNAQLNAAKAFLDAVAKLEKPVVQE